MVITMVNGANTYVANKLSTHGADVFSVTRMPAVIMSPEAYFKYQKRKMIHIEDYKAIESGCTECSEVGAMSAGHRGGLQRTIHHRDGPERNHVDDACAEQHRDCAWTRIHVGRRRNIATHNVIVGYNCGHILGLVIRSAKRSAWTAFHTPSRALGLDLARCLASQRTTGWQCRCRRTNRRTDTTIL